MLCHGLREFDMLCGIRHLCPLLSEVSDMPGKGHMWSLPGPSTIELLSYDLGALAYLALVGAGLGGLRLPCPRSSRLVLKRAASSGTPCSV